MAKTINMECPICKKKVLFVGVHDDEGNYHGLVGCEYENDPWSGLSYALHHEGWGDCPMCTDGAYSTMGGMLFDTADDAISALSLPNEPLTLISISDELPPDNERVLVYRPCMVDSDIGPYSVQWGWAAKRDGSHWARLPDRRPPEGEEDT